MALNPSNIPITAVDGGLKKDKPSIAIDPKYTPDCNNVVFVNGEVQKRTGLVWDNAMDSFSAGAPEQLMNMYHYQNFRHGSKEFKLAALEFDTPNYDLSMYHWDGAQWLLDDAITDANLVPTYNYCMNFAEVIKSTGDNGVPEKEYFVANCTTTSRLNITGGLTVKYNDQQADNNYTDVGTNYKARRVLSYFGRLILLGGAKSSANDLHAIHWSSQWDPLNFTTGSFGWFFTYDTGGGILNGELLRDKIICYKEDSIWEGSRLTADPYIRWSCVYPDVGLFGMQMLAKWGNYHVFAGTNNIYIYAGGSELYPIGTPIWDSFIADVRDGGVSAHKLYKDRGFCSVHRDRGDICFWIVSGTAHWPNKAYVYNMFNKTWTTWTLPVSADAATALVLTGWGEYEHDNTVTDAEFIPYYSAAAETVATGALTSFKTLKWDFTTYTDATPVASTIAHTTGIDAYWTTKVIISSLEEPTNWQKVSLEMKGLADSSTAIVAMSVDDGVTWVDKDDAESAWATESLSTTYTVTTVPFNRKGYSCQFKVSDATSAKGFALRSLEVVPVTDERKGSLS